MNWIIALVLDILAHLVVLFVCFKLIDIKSCHIWLRRDCMFMSCMCIVSIMDVVCFIKNWAIHPALWFMILLGIATLISSFSPSLNKWLDKEV